MCTAHGSFDVHRTSRCPIIFTPLKGENIILGSFFILVISGDLAATQPPLGELEDFNIPRPGVVTPVSLVINVSLFGSLRNGRSNDGETTVQ